jgi:hypothetical protein
MPTFTIVRCPMCGSTNAGEDGGLYEFAFMRCGSCGYNTYADHYQVIESWNVDVDFPPDATEIPERLPPQHEETPTDIPGACDECRSTTARQSLRRHSPRQKRFEPLRELGGDFWRCVQCILCYRHEVEPSLAIDDDEDILTRIDPATSIALLGVVGGDLTAEWLDALTAAPGFTEEVLDEALPLGHPLWRRLLRDGPS